MPDDATICPQCATPVQNVPTAPPPPQAPQPGAPTPASTSSWLNVPPAQTQYPPQAQPYQGQFQPQTDGKATASLVLGILSLLCFGLLTGLPAIILGHNSRGNIQQSRGRLTGAGMALAGLIMGYVSIVPTILIIAAIAIPNLLRSRIVANESAAASTVRIINTSQVTYSIKFPEHGYASDLSALGPGPAGSCSGEGTVEHACLLDNVLAGTQCTAGTWCSKGGYKYSMSAVCDSGPCSNYVITATPIVFGSTGRKSFCATSDAVVRFRYSEPRSTPLTADECAEWPPIA